MAVFDGPFRRKVDRSLAHNGEAQALLGACHTDMVNSRILTYSSSDTFRKKVMGNTVGNFVCACIFELKKSSGQRPERGEGRAE